MAVSRDSMEFPSRDGEDSGVSDDGAGESGPPTAIIRSRGRGLYIELPRGEEDLLQWLVTSDSVELLAGDGRRALKFRLQSSAREHDSTPPRLRLGFPNVVDRAGPERELRVRPRATDAIVVTDSRGRLRDVQVLDLSGTGMRLWHAGYAVIRHGARMSGLRLMLPGESVIRFSALVARVTEAEPDRGGQYVALRLEDKDLSRGNALAIRQYILDRHLDD